MSKTWVRQACGKAELCIHGVNKDSFFHDNVFLFNWAIERTLQYLCPNEFTGNKIQKQILLKWEYVKFHLM